MSECVWDGHLLSGTVSGNGFRRTSKGAKDRPARSAVWENAEARMLGKPVVHERDSLQSFSTGGLAGGHGLR